MPQDAGVSAETVAWIAALGTALGALIGASAGGVVDFVLARLTERREALAGARLTCLDLALAASMLKSAEDEGKWWVFYEIAMPGWDAHRAALAARLNLDDFEVVTQAVAELPRSATGSRKPLFRRVWPTAPLPRLGPT